MCLDRSVSIRVLTSPSLCRLQDVSAPWSVGFFPCPHKFLSDTLQIVGPRSSLSLGPLTYHVLIVLAECMFFFCIFFGFLIFLVGNTVGT